MAAVRGNRTKKIEANQQQVVLESVKGLRLAEVVSELGTTQVNVQQTLAELSATLTDKITQLQNIETAISIKEARLKELHDIDASATTLDDMKAQIAATEASWVEQQNARTQQWNEQAAERTKTLKREQDDYNYRITQERQRQTDEFETAVRTKQREEQNRQEMLTKGWQEREAVLKNAEKELTDLRARVANIQAEIDSATKREVAIESNRIKRDYEQQLQIARITADNDKKLAESAIINANAQISGLQGQINSLRNEVSAANERAETIATKALDASSGRQALDAIERSQTNRENPTGKTGR